MNIDTIVGEGTATKGDLKRGLGEVTGDAKLQQDGTVDQLTGELRKGFGQVRDFVNNNKAASYTAAAVFGLAVLNSLRGKGTRAA